VLYHNSNVKKSIYPCIYTAGNPALRRDQLFIKEINSLCNYITGSGAERKNAEL